MDELIGVGVLAVAFFIVTTTYYLKRRAKRLASERFTRAVNTVLAFREEVETPLWSGSEYMSERCDLASNLFWLGATDAAAARFRLTSEEFLSAARWVQNEIPSKNCQSAYTVLNFHQSRFFDHEGYKAIFAGIKAYQQRSRQLLFQIEDDSVTHQARAKLREFLNDPAFPLNNAALTRASAGALQVRPYEPLELNPHHDEYRYIS